MDVARRRHIDDAVVDLVRRQNFISGLAGQAGLAWMFGLYLPNSGGSGYDLPAKVDAAGEIPWTATPPAGWGPAYRNYPSPTSGTAVFTSPTGTPTDGRADSHVFVEGTGPTIAVAHLRLDPSDQPAGTYDFEMSLLFARDMPATSSPGVHNPAFPANTISDGRYALGSTYAKRTVTFPGDSQDFTCWGIVDMVAGDWIGVYASQSLATGTTRKIRDGGLLVLQFT